MKVFVSLTVKFRFLKITLGTLHKEWVVPLDIPAISDGTELIRFNDRGVNLVVRLGR
jgi:hypothetical protein